MGKGKKGKSGKREQGSTVYNGPIVPPLSKFSIPAVKRVQRVTAVAASDGAGLLRGSFGNNPSGGSDWSNWITTWTEYRVLGFEVEYIPAFENSYPTSTAVGGLLVAYVDRQSSASSPSSANQVLAYDGSKYVSMNKHLKIITKATGTNEMQWLNTASPSAWCSIRYCSTALSISTTYGTFVITWLIEFRSSQ
jgi:hypothetical protein